MEQSENDRRIDYIELNVADIERSHAFYYADDLVAIQRQVEAAGGRIAKPIFDFPADGVSTFSIPTVTNGQCGRRGD